MTLLPDEKNTPGLNPLNKKTMLYGPQKIGKSTLVSKLYPNAAFIGTDPTGLEELEVFKVQCRDWTTFRRIGQELAQYLQTHPPGSENCLYDAICVDTVDELVRFCRQEVLSMLSGGPNRKADDFVHESDWEYGKAWNAVTEEFRLRVAKLCNLGLPVVFVSHSKVATKKDRTGLEITVHSPDVGSGQLREWLLKFVDYIFFAEMLGSADGEQRILHTMPSEKWLAGARQPEGKPLLPEPLPLDGARLRAALAATMRPYELKGGEGGTGTPSPSSAPGAEAFEDFLTPEAKAREGQSTPENGKPDEPKTVQTARATIAAIDEERVKNTGYTAKEQKALQTIAKHEAKQREKAST